MVEFREWLSGLVSKVGVSWREKRKSKKDNDIKERSGIDKERWFSALPEEVKKPVQIIVDKLGDDEGVDESFHPIINALHTLVPEYPYLHWRSLHPEIKNASERGYIDKNYYNAFLEASKRYVKKTGEYSGVRDRSDMDLMGMVYGPEEGKVLKVAVGFCRQNKTEFAEKTIQNIEGAQRKLSQGVIEGGRNIVAHEEQIDLVDSGLFSEKDCLDLLSLISHLMCRAEHANEKRL